MHVLTVLSLTSAAIAVLPARQRATITAKPAATVKLPSRAETTPYLTTMTHAMIAQLGDGCGAETYTLASTSTVVVEVVCKPEPTITCVPRPAGEYGSQCQQSTCTNPPINFETAVCPSNHVQTITKTQYGTAGCLTYKCNQCRTVDCFCGSLPGGPYNLEWYTDSSGCRNCRCVPVSLPTQAPY